jgi:hypothetical protein
MSPFTSQLISAARKPEHDLQLRTTSRRVSYVASFFEEKLNGVELLKLFAEETNKEAFKTAIKQALGG